VYIRYAAQPAQPDDWDLDPQFFSALSQWTILHPESSIERVFEKVLADIDNAKEIMELIPNGPFPARGLIGSLVLLVKLGIVWGFHVSFKDLLNHSFM
jgi:hypothetical protein